MNALSLNQRFFSIKHGTTVIIYTLLFFIISSGTVHAQTSQTDLDKYIKFKIERDHIPGLAVCIIKEGKIVWSKGYGWANIEKKIPMTERSVLGIASITKLVTAIAIMQLVEQKKLNLDTPINTYLPLSIHHPDHPTVPITVSQLLTHTASISNGPSLWRSITHENQIIGLEEWVRAYFLPEGKFYHKDGNFARWKLGEIIPI